MASDPDPVNRSGAFEVVRRGYARDQVDALVRELERRATAAENARRMAEQHAASIAEDLRVLRAGTPAEGLPVAPQSFGFRAEKVLRLAEREGAEIRAAAQREAEAVREAAEREVEAVREAAARAAEAMREAAARDAAEIRAAGTREAADLMGRAHADAAQARTEADAQRAAAAAGRAESAALRGQVEQGGAELRALRGAVRAELSRLHALLGAQLQGLSEPMATPETPAAEQDAPGAGVETTAGTAEHAAPQTAEQAATEGPAWTPTPGTADLFDTPPRPMPPVPAQRVDTGENRHSLRSG